MKSNIFIRMMAVEDINMQSCTQSGILLENKRDIFYENIVRCKRITLCAIRRIR